jgi:hypothetical protein
MFDVWPQDDCGVKLIDAFRSMVHDLLRIAEENLNVIDIPTFVRHLKFLLQGIASDTFKLEKVCGLCCIWCSYVRLHQDDECKVDTGWMCPDEKYLIPSIISFILSLVFSPRGSKDRKCST